MSEIKESSNWDILNINLSKIEIKDLNQLLSDFKKDKENFDFKTLDDNDLELSLEEKNIIERLSQEVDKIIYIEKLIDLKKIQEKNIGVEMVYEEQNRKMENYNNFDDIKERYKYINAYHYSFNEIKHILKILNNEYSNYSADSWESKLDVIMPTIDQLNSQNDIRVFQKMLINRFIWNNEWENKWFNNSYIVWFNETEGNNIIEISDYENNLQNDAFDIFKDYSLLKNYLSKINNDWDLNANFLIHNFSHNNLKKIKEFLLTSNIIIAPLLNILKENDLYDNLVKNLNEINEIEISNEEWQQSKELFTIKEEFFQKDDSFFNDYRHNIILINDENKLFSILKFIKENNQEKLNIRYINKEIIEKIPNILIDKSLDINIDTIGINSIPTKLFENNLYELIKKYPKIKWDLLVKAFNLKIDYEKITIVINKIFSNSQENTLNSDLPIAERNIIKNEENIQNLKIESIRDLITQKNTNEATFLESYNKIINTNSLHEISDTDRKNVTNYIIKNFKDNEKQAISLAEKWFYWTNDIFLSIENKWIEYSKCLLKKNINHIKYINKDLLNNYEIVEMIINWIKNPNNPLEQKLIWYYLFNTDFKNINFFLSFMKKFSEKLWYSSPQYLIYTLLLNKTITNKLYTLLESKNQFINTENQDLYENLKKWLVENLPEMQKEADDTWNNLEKISKTSGGNNEFILKKFKEFTDDKIPGFDEKINGMKHLSSLKIINDFISNDKDRRISSYSSLKFLIPDEEKFKLTIRFLLNLEVDVIKKEKTEEDKKINTKIYKKHPNIEKYFEENNIKWYEKLEEKDIVKLIIASDISKEDEAELRWIILAAKEKSSIYDKRIKNAKLEIENVDSYITYMNNPEQKWTFEEYLKVEEDIKQWKIDAQKLSNESNNYILTSENNYTKKGSWYIMETNSWEEINISVEEKKITQWNPEATENLINFYEYCKDLNINFAWEFRSELIQSMNQIKWTSWIDINDTNFIDKTELNKLLNFILEIIWEKWDINSISWTLWIIRSINWSGILNNKKDTITWLSNIWKKFEHLWYIWEWWNTFDTKNKTNILSYKEILNKKRTD